MTKTRTFSINDIKRRGKMLGSDYIRECMGAAVSINGDCVVIPVDEAKRIGKKYSNRKGRKNLTGCKSCKERMLRKMREEK